MLASLRGISKRFGAVQALDGVSLDLAAGEVHALLGENGAGKSSLMNVLAGLYRQDEGEIAVDDRPVQLHSPADARRLGIGMVHQEQRLVERFTAAQNIALGHPRSPLILSAGRFQALAVQVSRRFQLTVDAETPVWMLPLGRRERVELVRLLHQGARVVILDEPTGNLSPVEVETFFDAMRQLTAEGKGVVFITHRLDEVERYADRVTVMRAGRVVRTFAAGQCDRAELLRMMVGAEAPRDLDSFVPEPATPGGPLLEVSGLRFGQAGYRDCLDGVDLTIRSGEAIGLAGVAGNGQQHLAEALTGHRPGAEGRILLGGTDIRGLSSRAVADLGVAYIPEDRKTVGLVMSQSIAVNLALRRIDRPPFSRRGVTDWTAVRAAAREQIERYGIRPSNPDLPVASLSGGNQQRVVVARELEGSPRLIVADELTRGLDPTSAGQFRRVLFDQRARGAGVLWITSDLSEALACDAVAVMKRGRIVGILPRETATREAVGRMMAGDE
ncbi:MAG: ABC transporter ATP-binding protein [Chloroflexi bacterium]|nr:ABC transporter ATP-binding protein [Chloroflexota bacterium]